jgi:TPR repeat protein
MPVFDALEKCDGYKPETKYQGFSVLKKLANEGNAMAMYELSQCYKKGNRGCPTTDKEKAKDEKFESFLTQREASYKEPAEEVYNNKHLEDKELFWEAFRENIEPPTPQIKEVDGYKPQSEIGE